MAKFVFKLEAVLRHRKHLEQERQRELGDVQAVMTQLRTKLSDLDASIKNSTEDLRVNRLVGPLDMRFLAAHRRFTFAVRQEASVVIQSIGRQQVKVEEAQRNLAEAAKQRKIIEKLREKHLERWRAEQSQKELAELDEVGSQIGYRAMLAAQEEQQAT